MTDPITKAFDLETFLISRLRPAPAPVCLSWYDGRRGAVIPHGPGLVDWIERQLRDPAVYLTGHNVAGFDFPVLLALEPELAPLIFDAFESGRISDTMIRQQLYFIATRPSFDDSVPAYSLAQLVNLIFDRDISAGKGPDAWRTRYGELYRVDFVDWPQEAIDYPLSDAREAWLCHDMQRERASDRIRCDADMAYAAFCLSMMAARGIRTDAWMVDRMEARWRAELERLTPRLIDAGLLAWGGTKKAPRLVKKDKAARERIAQAWGLDEPMLTKNGEKRARKAEESGTYTPELRDYAIDKAACIATGDGLMLDRARYVLAEKILSTYLPPMRAGTTGPVTTRFNLASTMRTTSSAPKGNDDRVGTNLQNANRDGGVRECIRAREGFALLAADLAAAELHTLAEVCKRKVGYSVLGDLLNSGEDAHLYLASKLIGCEYNDDLKARKKQGDPAIVEARQRAKPGNFGFGGAMGWRKFIVYNLRQGALYDASGRPTVDAVVFTPEQAQALKRAWLDAYPEMKEYFEVCRAELGPHESCVIELWPGGPLRRVQGLAMICNSYFQAPAAHGAKLGLRAVTRECHIGRLQRVYPVNFVHDELLGEVRISDHMHSDAELFAQILQTEFNKMVPNYPTTVEPVLMTHYSKKAEPTYDSDGRLIPWTLKT